MSEEKTLIIRWDESKKELKEALEPEKETRFTYGGNDVLLLVVIKDPERIPRVMATSIEDPSLFLSEDFEGTWSDIGDKVRAEISRIIVK